MLGGHKERMRRPPRYGAGADVMPDSRPMPVSCPIAEGLSQGLCPRPPAFTRNLSRKAQRDGPPSSRTRPGGGSESESTSFRFTVPHCQWWPPLAVTVIVWFNAATVAEVLAAQVRDSERLGSFRVGGCLSRSPPQVSNRKAKRQLELSLLKDRD